jgi:hypothetical protein
MRQSACWLKLQFIFVEIGPHGVEIGPHVYVSCKREQPAISMLAGMTSSRPGTISRKEPFALFAWWAGHLALTSLPILVVPMSGRRWVATQGCVVWSHAALGMVSGGVPLYARTSNAQSFADERQEAPCTQEEVRYFSAVHRIGMMHACGGIRKLAYTMVPQCMYAACTN